MVCTDLQNDSPDWFLCEDLDFIPSLACGRVPEVRFQIEVLDDQNIPVTFTFFDFITGDREGTITEPGLYKVNELKNPPTPIPFHEFPNVKGECESLGFPDGRFLTVGDSLTPRGDYYICIEYEDEQGNDCSTISLAAGETRTCIVKNYINFGFNLLDR